MSMTIEERIVAMRFDNKQFEEGVRTSLETLEKLKQKLNFSGASKGLENVTAAAKGFDTSGMGKAVDDVKLKFSALQVIAVTALTNITNSAMHTGKKLISALTIDPVKTGFQEYETQINAVQTILANTKSKGSTLKDVNEALDTLNKYADLTIYNFTEMTRNIGTFTAAGIDLETSVNAIQGIANLAAISGSTSQQASTAMYQLSQALASGTVKLMDWNSVVNAGMGGQVFQDALKETARAHGIAVDNMIKKNGSFRESLQEGWISSDILTETLQHFTEFTDEYNEKTLKAQGYTDEQIKAIKELGVTGTEAATKVKTFTQLWDTLKEAAQSGWTQSWEIIIGDFEEARDLLTNISDVFNKVIGASADARNAILQGWKDLGGRQDLIDSFWNVYEAIQSVVKPLRAAFNEIIPPITSERLKAITAGLVEFTKKLQLTESESDSLKNTFKGILAVVDIFAKGISVAVKAIAGLALSDGFRSIIDLLLSISGAIGNVIAAIDGAFSVGGLNNIFSSATDVISLFLSVITGKVDAVGQAFGKLGEWMQNVGHSIVETFKMMTSAATSKFSLEDVLKTVAAGGLFIAAKRLVEIVDMIKNTISNFGTTVSNEVKKFSNLFGLKDALLKNLDALHTALINFPKGLRIVSLLSIASAVAILAGAMNVISKLKGEDIAKSLVAMSLMFRMLSKTFEKLIEVINEKSTKGVIKAGIAMYAMSNAVKVLAKAMVDLGALSWEQIGRGLSGIAGGLIALVAATKRIDASGVTMKSILMILALAEASKTLSKSVSSFAKLSWDELSRGLFAMGGALTEMVLSLEGLERHVSGKSFVGVMSLSIMANSLINVAIALKKLGKLSWEEITRGIYAMGVTMAELVAVIYAFNNIEGSALSKIVGAATFAMLTDSLMTLATGLKEFGSMSWDEIEKGLIAMGAAITELAIVVVGFNQLGGLGSIIGSVALAVVVNSLMDLAKALNELGSMSWDQIKKACWSLAIVLSELGLTIGILGSIGLAPVLGAAALLIIISSLDELASALSEIGKMSWSEIGRGLTGLGGALTELGTVTTLVGGLGGLASIIGAESIKIGVSALGKLAEALKSFAQMSWDETRLAISAMGAALAELAAGSIVNTLSFLGSLSIEKAAAPLGVLAQSVKAWKDVTVPENLSDELKALGGAVREFTFGAIGSGAIEKVAAPLGVMADSIKKWKDIDLPTNFGKTLGSIAEGINGFALSFVSGGSFYVLSQTIGGFAKGVEKLNNTKFDPKMGEKLGKFGDAIKEFAQNIFDVGLLDGTKISSLSSGIEKLAKAVEAINGADTSKVGKFVENVNKLNNIDVDTENLKTTAKGVKSSMKNMMKSVSSMIDNSKATVSSSMSATVSAMSAAVKSSASSVSSSMESVMNGLVSSINSKKSAVNAAVKSAVSGCATYVRNQKGSMQSAGNDLGQGLVNGINAKKTSVYNAGYALGQAAVKGEKAGQKSNSPSKLTIQAGKWIGEGLVIGMEKTTSQVYSAGYTMGETATDAISNTLSILSNSIDTEIDADPTIRPVLDLSEISSGAKSIGGLLGNEYSLAAAGDIGYMMNQRIQNGANSDVVSAINKLRKDLSGVGTTVNNINGVTYDDGSNINSAVQDLVRAAKVERRS